MKYSIWLGRCMLSFMEIGSVHMYLRKSRRDKIGIQGREPLCLVLNKSHYFLNNPLTVNLNINKFRLGAWCTLHMRRWKDRARTRELQYPVCFTQLHWQVLVTIFKNQTHKISIAVKNLSLLCDNECPTH